MNKEHTTFQIELTAQPSHRTPPPGIARIYDVNFFQVGEPNGWVITPPVVEPVVGMWEGIEVLMDHSPIFSGPSVHHLVGLARAPRWDGHTVSGELHILQLKQSEPAIELLDLIVTMKQQGQPTPKVGMSTDTYLTWEERGNKRFVTSIDRISTADIVVHPAAGGEINHAIFQQRGTTMNKVKCQCGVEYEDGTQHTCAPTPPQPPAHAPMSTTVQPADVHAAVTNALREADEQLAQQCAQLLNVKLSAAALPTGLSDMVRARFEDEQGNTRIFKPDELEAEIARARAAHTQLSAQVAVQGMGHPVQDSRRRPATSGMYDSLDRITAAYERLMGLPVAAQFSDVPRLTGIRELYVGLTGDRNMRGIFQPEHVQFAVSVASTPQTAAILANITADVMNKLALQSWSAWSAAGYNWYKRVAKPKDFSTLQDAKFIVLGGVANVPTVAEGAVYTELTIDDKKEQFAFVKKGGYLPLTIEAIDKDDTESWRSVGEKLGIAAIRTLSADVASLLTTNAAIDEDSVAWFHDNHGNLLAQDLDAAGWQAAGELIYEQTEVNSAKTLAIWPDRVVVPVQKRRKAISLFFSDREPGSDFNDINVAALDGTKDSEGPVIVCPELTDHDDWYALCNPLLQPVIGIGYRFGDRPEIFSAADATSFLMFYQDCLPIKVRWFYAAGVVDYRGICKSVL